MWPFRRRQAVTMRVDPFGEMTFRAKDHAWDGSFVFPPIAEYTTVELPGTEAGPDSSAIRAIDELTVRYNGLRESIGVALLDTWSTDDVEGLPNPKTPEAMLDVLKLDGITVKTPDDLDLDFVFSEEGLWDDAWFNVVIRAWDVKYATLSD